MANGKSARGSAPTIPEDEPLINEIGAEAEDPGQSSDPKADPATEKQQQAVMTLIQGVAIAQAKGGCWSIKQAGVLNNAVKQLTGNLEPSKLPPFDASEPPADGIPPQQRCVIFLIQAVGFGQAKGAFNLEQASILDAAMDTLTTEDKSA